MEKVNFLSRAIVVVVVVVVPFVVFFSFASLLADS